MEDKVFYENVYELHKAGLIDLMARSSVAEDNPERKAREAEPEVYALTFEESVDVTWSYNIYDAVIYLNGFIEKDPATGLSVRIINQDSTKMILQAYTERGLDPNYLYSLANRVLNGNWFTLILSEKRLPEHSKAPGFSLLANVNGKTKKGVLTAEKYPALYDGYHSKAEIRDALNLPEDCKFLFSTEWDILNVLKTICNPNPNKAAIPLEQRYLSPVPNRVVTPSTKLTEKLFTPEHIEFLPEEQNQYTVEENGQITLFQQSKNEIEELHAQVIGILFAIFINQAEEKDDAEEPQNRAESQTISFYAPDFCRKAGIDPREYSAKRDKSTSIKDLRWHAIVKRLKPLETVMGKSLDGVWYRILTIESYDREREIIKVRMPYLSKIYEILTVKTLEEKHGQINTLFSSTVINEPNSAAFELANYLLNQLLQLGNYGKDRHGIIRYNTKYTTLISNCPQLQRALDKIQTEGNATTRTQAYNAKLKQTFEAAYRIIYTKSDAQDFFIDFQINGVKSWKTTAKNGRNVPPNFRIPTKTQINDKLVITHRGKNPDYRKPEK